MCMGRMCEINVLHVGVSWVCRYAYVYTPNVYVNCIIIQLQRLSCFWYAGYTMYVKSGVGNLHITVLGPQAFGVYSKLTF